MVKAYTYKVGPEDVKTAPLNVVSSFSDFVNTFQYTTRERDIAFGILSVMLLAVVVLICAVRIDRDESRYIRKLQAKARKRGYKVDWSTKPHATPHTPALPFEGIKNLYKHKHDPIFNKDAYL